MTSLGGAVVASWAGHSDAATDPKVPRTDALRNGAAVGATSRMDTTKYRSPMDRVTMARRNLPR
jgi:hypothetical protein